MRFRRTAILTILLLAALAAAGPAGARNRERSVRLYRGVSAFLPPDGLLNLGLAGQTRSIQLPDTDGLIPADHTTIAFEMEYGLRSWLRLRADLPFHVWVGRPDDPASGSGPGDPRLACVLALPTPWRALGLALDLRTTIPAGAVEDGLGEGEPSRYHGLSAGLRLWRESQLPELRLHLNYGRRVNGAADGTALPMGGAFSPYRPLYPAGEGGDNDFTCLLGAVEFRKGITSQWLEYAEYRLPDAADVGDKEISRFATAALRWGDETGWGLDFAMDLPLAVEDAATALPVELPDLVYHLGISYGFGFGGRDSDGDGLKDRVDPCPRAAEDVDGHLDEDGCPDPDNDLDGVPDMFDAAPDTPEDVDGFQDEDGVPDPDNDFDGIPDREDDCPDEAEDRDGYQDEDGCPEEFLDRDGDGIADADDICPDEAEDFDGFQDEDGCPDPDNDLDGIPDAEDACPDQPEDYDGDEDDDGCPE